jgi:hypothetical protein
MVTDSTITPPEYVKKLGDNVTKKWTAAYTASLPYGEGPAFFAANQFLQNNLIQESIIARTKDITPVETFTISLDSSEQIISRTEDGDEVISFKLADVFEDKFGVKIPEEILQSWADAINSGKTLLGDVDHDYLNQLATKGLSLQEIKTAMNQKPGIAKTVKAVLDKGRLWVQAVLDKRYKKIVEKSKGVSLEAHIRRDAQGNVVDGSLLGFTFGIKKDPVIEGTGIDLHAA